MKIVLLVFFLLLNLDASSLKRSLIINKEISKDDIKYQNFKAVEFEKELYKKAYVKIILNKKLLKNNTFYLRVICDVKNISYSNVEYETSYDNIVFKLDKNTPKELLLNFNFKQEQAVKLAIIRLTQFEYKYILKKESLFYGIAYGIIFCAFLYNFVIFLYSRENSFLYYSLMQFCLIIILYYAVLLENQTFITLRQQILTDFFETLCILLMILFSKEILNTKKHLKFLNKVLNFLIYLSVVDLITIFIFSYSLLYSLVPRSLIISVLVISGLMAMFKGQKIAIYYFFAWFVVFLCLIMSEHDFLDINELYIIHIGLPLESLILSFALGFMLKISMDEKAEKEKMLIQQSKLASMGEMLNNIAHQWRQPLTNLSFINMDLKMAIKNKDISDSYLYEIAKDSSSQINFMSETLESFKGFYQPNRKKQKFKISQAVNNLINIMNPLLQKEQIFLEFELIKDKEVFSYENEYSQVVLNLITNARDALLERDIDNPYIKISLDLDTNQKSILTVCDNAKGIAKNIISKIFDPYFTTKHKNSGIGLYMTKVIVESHLKAEISVSNTQDGACFKIKM